MFSDLTSFWPFLTTSHDKFKSNTLIYQYLFIEMCQLGGYLNWTIKCTPLDWLQVYPKLP